LPAAKATAARVFMVMALIFLQDKEGPSLTICTAEINSGVVQRSSAAT